MHEILIILLLFVWIGKKSYANMITFMHSNSRISTSEWFIPSTLGLCWGVFCIYVRCDWILCACNGYLGICLWLSSLPLINNYRQDKIDWLWNNDIKSRDGVPYEIIKMVILSTALTSHGMFSTTFGEREQFLIVPNFQWYFKKGQKIIISN